jgi:hypothetical protein
MLGLMDSRLNSASAATFSTSMVCRTGSKQDANLLLLNGSRSNCCGCVAAWISVCRYLQDWVQPCRILV